MDEIEPTEETYPGPLCACGGALEEFAGVGGAHWSCEVCGPVVSAGAEL